MGFDKFKQPLMTAAGISDGQAHLLGITVNLTAAQIQGMNGTPVNIVPAPGANNFLVIESIAFKMTAGAVGFSGGGTVQFQYHASPNAVVHQGTIPASVITSPSGTTYTVLQAAAGSNGLTAPLNSGIDITNNGGAFTGGTGATAKVYIVYRKVVGL